jgi:hypothetical protein
VSKRKSDPVYRIKERKGDWEEHSGKWYFYPSAGKAVPRHLPAPHLEAARERALRRVGQKRFGFWSKVERAAT